VPLSINALATTFSVSRKHVLTLLRDAEAQETLFATIFLLFAQCAEQSQPARAEDSPRRAPG
jgi:hypothetical protein